MGEGAHTASIVRTQKDSGKGLSTTVPPLEGAGRLGRTALPPRKKQGGL